MFVMAIRVDMSEELHHKILSAMFGENRQSGHVKFAELAKQIGVTKEVIRYQVEKLKTLKYIREIGKDEGYELTKAVIFPKLKNG